MPRRIHMLTGLINTGCHDVPDTDQLSSLIDDINIPGSITVDDDKITITTDDGYSVCVALQDVAPVYYLHPVSLSDITMPSLKQEEMQQRREQKRNNKQACRTFNQMQHIKYKAHRNMIKNKYR